MNLYTARLYAINGIPQARISGIQTKENPYRFFENL